MASVRDIKQWRDELKETLGVCAQRASLPVTLPHCAICARYATDNLPFEALMSLLDVMPHELHAEALAAAADRLSAMPPAMRQQQVSAVTLPALMESPGWPLVRSLVIDMADQSIHQHFDDSRLIAIEEITLLGFAYGGCELTPAFNRALFDSRSFVNVRSLIFHSVESDADTSRQFWTSPLARRLERINGVPYFGDPVVGPLAVRELVLASYGKIADGLSFSRLLDPDATPQLANLSLGAYFEAVPPFLQLLAAEREMVERIDSVSLRLSDFDGEQTQLLRSATLPTSVHEVSWNSDYRHVSRIRIRGGCDIHTLYDFADEQVDIRLGDKATHYGSLVFDWRLRDGISRRVEDLSLLLPLEIDIGDVVNFCTEFPRLKKLSLVYPFSEAELETLLNAELIRRLQALTLLLCVDGGQWDFGGADANRSNEYMQANEGRYQSDVAPKFLFDLAFGERTASIHNLSIATQSFELTRSPERVQHCDLWTAEAAHAFAERDPQQPIEVLCLDFDIDKRLAKDLTGCGVLGRVYRLNIRGQLDDTAAGVLAGCEALRTVRVFSHWCFHNPPEAIRAMIHSPHLTGAWDVDLSLPGSRKVPDIEAMCAESPLLDHAVALGLDVESTLIPASGRLGRVRRLDESLTMRVLGDARLAAVWRDHPIGRPLRARLADYVERSYRVNHTLDELPGLERKLAELSPFQEEEGFVQALRAVLATAFGGQPVAEGTPFGELSEPQRGALQAIAALDDDWWCIGGLMRDAMTSYGFPFLDNERLNDYIAGAGSASN